MRLMTKRDTSGLTIILLPSTVFAKFFNHIQGNILAETEFHAFQTNMAIISQWTDSRKEKEDKNI